MGSQTDLDQGGTSRQWALADMGPTVGKVRVPIQNILDITVAGTYNIDPSTSLIRVNVAGLVTVVLPSAANPAYQGAAGAQPGLFVKNPIIICDVGGNALNFPITINPQSGQTILGVASVQINHNWAAYILQPLPDVLSWTNVAV